MSILHPECKQSCNNQFSNNRLTVKGNQKISSKKPCINQARRVFTAKKIPDSCRKQEELKRAAGRASACLVPPTQLVTAVARAEGSKRAHPQPALPSCKQPRLESTHKSTCGTSKHLLAVTPGPHVIYPRLDSALFLRRQQKCKFSDTHGQDKIQANVPCQEKFPLCKLS